MCKCADKYIDEATGMQSDMYVCVYAPLVDYLMCASLC